MIHALRTRLRAMAKGHRTHAPARRSVAGYILPALGLIAFFYYARPVVLPVMMACIVSMALKPCMRWFARWHIPAAIAAALIMAVFLAAASCFFYRVGGPAVEWAKRAPTTTAEFRLKIEKILHLNREEAPPQKAPPQNAGNTNVTQPAPQPLADSQTTNAILAWTGSTLAGVVETVVLLFLILISNGWFSQKLATILAPHYERQWVIESMEELQRQISHYLFSITLINTAFGLIIGVALAMIGLPNAVMWGGLAALLNFIPYFGPFFGMVVVGIVGILTFNTLPKEILPFAFYVGMHILESDLVTPLILGRRFTIHPLVIFVSLLFWTWLWGVPGSLLAVPMLVALKVAGERHPPLSAIGDLLK